MSIDASKVGICTADLMDVLAEEYGDEDVTVGTVMVLAEISGKDGDDDWTAIQWRCTDPRSWIQVGMLTAAKEGL